MRNLARTLTALPPRSTAPSGHTRPPHAPAPIDLGILAHMTAARDELVAHARDAAPDAPLAPVPRDAAAIYQWWADNTPYLDAAALRVGEAMVYRQGLEHALRAHDTTVIRREPCPSCGCYSLVWRGMEQRAVCVNDRDIDENGRYQRFTLARLAQQAVENSPVRAAT
jgi:hypothetical protein